LKTRYVAIAFFSSLFAGIFFIHLFTKWWVFRTTGIYGGIFFDLQSVINSYECFKEYGIEIYKYDPTALCMVGFMYGISLMYILSIILSIVSSTTAIAIIGLILVSITLGAISQIFWSGTKKSAFFLIFCLSSPGIWLLVERGNVDEWVLILLFIASTSFSRRRDYLGVSVIAISVLLKFYTLPLLFFIPLLSRNKKLRVFSLVIGILLTPITLWNISLVHSFPSSWFVSFGAPVLPKYAETIGISLPSPVFHAIGLIVIALLVLVITLAPKIQRIQISQWFTVPPSRKIDDVITSIFGATFIICYFSGTNYDYRLVYLAIFGSGLIKRLNTAGELKLIFPVILIISLWCTDFFFSIHVQYSYGVWQFVGDIAIMLFVAVILHSLLPTIKNSMNQQKRY
jgi:hypothetical protein